MKIPTSTICLMLLAMMFCGCRDKSPGLSEKHPYDISGFQPIATCIRTADLSSGMSGGFVSAAKIATPAVVHIKTAYAVEATNIFGFSQPIPARGSGSGVIISADGYIATNNHVVESANEILVVFPDRRQFKAKLIGRDAQTDLALLKVEATDITYIPFGNSDAAEIGEWVLAVGYPYSLNTTVTAGIISAKGRSIGILSDSRTSNQSGNPFTASAIESFIQTDAAINAGNSGGALVNIKGELIGINAAIASTTGSYAGYSFAVPINLAKKILEDLKEFGAVRRGFLGISFPLPAIEDELLKKIGIEPGSVKGVLITEVQKRSAAEAAGLKPGDFIQKLDSIDIYSSAEFSERIGRRRPGDKVRIQYIRNGKVQTTTALLTGEEAQKTANEELAAEVFKKLGAQFSPVSKEEKSRYDISSGVVVTDIEPGGYFHEIGLPEKTILLAINGIEVAKENDVKKAIAENSSVLQIIAVLPDGTKIAFTISIAT